MRLASERDAATTQSPPPALLALPTTASEMRRASGSKTLRTVFGETNARLPISITRPNVGMPRNKTMPPWTNTAISSTHGRVSRGQTSAQYDSSQKTVSVRHEVEQPADDLASQVMSSDWYSSMANESQLASPVDPRLALQFPDAGEQVDDAHVHLDQANGEVGRGAWRHFGRRRARSRHSRSIE